MKKVYLFLFVLLLIASGCSKDEGKRNSEKRKSVVETNGLEELIIAKNLTIPWTINKAEGSFYLSQRPGFVIEVDEETGEHSKQEVVVTEPIVHTGEGGFLGYILAPDFETSQNAFAYHTYEENNQLFNRVITLKLTNNQWVEQEVLLDRIPGSNIHNGGRLKIGPDNQLYVTTGDAANPDLSQDLTSLAGKILRMDLQGKIPNDNPFEDSYIYSYGHRNPQGLAWDSSGTLYSTEHGQSAHDEINLIQPGHNYGWPIIQGDEQAEHMERPLFHTGTETWAPSGIAIVEDRLYIATLRGSKLIRFNLEDSSYDVVYDDAGRLRDVFSENGNLFIITNNLDGRGTPKEDDDKLIRLSGF